MVFDIGGELVEVPDSSIKELIAWCHEEGSEDSLAIAASLEEHVVEDEDEE